MNFAEPVMSTILSISSSINTPYTVVGGKAGAAESGFLSCILLSRGGRQFRSSCLQELSMQGFSEIVILEKPGSGYDVESLSRKYPDVRFVIPHEKVSHGEAVNMGMTETDSKFALVLWTDMRLFQGTTAGKLKDRLSAPEMLCKVPVILNNKNEVVPSVQAPAFFKNMLKVIPVVPQSEPVKTLFPYDFCGIYSKERFFKLGGYDRNIRNPYWQKMDFGFRAGLWDERIVVNPFLKIVYEEELSVEDTTPDSCYPLFFLKNLAVKMKKGAAILPLSRLPAHLSASGGNVFSAVREFSQARSWVAMNSLRFKRDARRVIEQWGA